MTSTVLPPVTASVPMARAMLPVPMMVMLPMSGAFPVVGSEGGGAAVGDQFQAVDVAGVVGGEEQGDRRDFLGAAHFPAGDEGLEGVPGCLVEQFGAGQCHAGRAAGDHRDLAIELSHDHSVGFDGYPKPPGFR